MEREEACDWYPTPNLRMCLGILQQQFRRVLVDYRHYNGSSRPMRCQSAETEWRDVRQATDQEIAEIRVRASQETSPAPAERTVWTKTSDSDPYCIHCGKTWDMHICDGRSSCPTSNRRESR